VLNDEPRPEDLPAPRPSPYAALPPELDPRPTRPAERSGPDGMMGSTTRKVVAAVAVIALLAATLLAVWGLVHSADPVAGDTWSQSGGAPGPPAATAAPGAPGAPTGGSSGSGSGAPADTDYPAGLAAFYTQRVDWTSCGDTTNHQCATIEVPVDYAKPGGERFRLAVRKAPATDPGKRLGSLLVNPGGPGASGVQYAQLSAFEFTKAVRAAYDIVGFDPRGIGQSSPVRCMSNADLDRLFSLDPTPDSPTERSTLISETDRITADCAQRGGERVRHLSTTEVARDMDVLRVLLGDRKLNFFGGSYGTFLGAIYADTFPQKVGRMVLDSAMSPNQTDEQQMTYDIQGFESSMNAFVDWCVARPGCALGSDRTAARSKIVALMDAVEKDGLVTRKPGLQRIGEGWVGFSIFMCLYSSQSWPTLNKGLAQAFTGQGDILLAKGMAVTERNASGQFADSSYMQVILPVLCTDWPRTPTTAAMRSLQARAKAAHPLWARMTGELYDSCRAWPTKGRTLKGGALAVGAAPILVIGNERDPATPIGGTKQLAGDLDSGVLLTSNHDGHGTYFVGSSCVDTAVDDYLVDGTVPPDGETC
jgi:pimeloyl-ACP methyl ester carboxylesterase